MNVAATNILGLHVSAVTMEDALETIDGWIARREHRYVCVSNVHSVMESWDDPALRRIHNEAGLVTPDGMPLVWVSRLRGQRHVRRVYGPDLMLALCAHGVRRGYRHFLYGGDDGIAERLNVPAVYLLRCEPGSMPDTKRLLSPPRPPHRVLFRPSDKPVRHHEPGGLVNGTQSRVITALHDAAPFRPSCARLLDNL